MSPSPPRGSSPFFKNNRQKINFIKEYIKHAENLQKISNLNRNNLKFHIEKSGKYEAKLSLKNNRGENQAYLYVTPELMNNNKVSLNLSLGESHQKLKGYGLFLRSLANKIARNIGSTETTQLAVNIRGMGGNKAPSSHLLERMGANTTWISTNSSARRHKINPLKSRTTKILAKRYGVRPPNLPRRLDKALFISVKSKNLPINAHSLANSHNFILEQIPNRQLKDALDRLKRRVHQKMISPRNLLSFYILSLKGRARARDERILQLEKRKARTAMRRPKGRTLVNYSNL